MKYFIFLLFLSRLGFAYELQATVFEKGTRIALKNTNVFILPEKLKAVTDESGKITVKDIQEETVQVVISVTEFLRFEKTVNLKEKSDFVFYVEKENYNSFETVVIDQKNKKDQSQKSLTRKQVLEMPGASGDPLKAVQNLPGVNRSTGFSSQVVIQGSAPKDTAYDFEGHDIPIVFHFGGLTSVVMPEALDQIDYLSAGYGPEYSRALGGIISLKARKPELGDRNHKGLFYMDNLSAGGLFESKIDDKQSFLISGRYSYIGFFLKQALKDNEALNLTVAPEFQDLTAVYNNDISENENLKVSLLASRDRLAFVLEEPLREDPSIRGSFTNTVNFFRIIPSYTYKLDSDSTVKASIGAGKDEIGVEIGDQYFKLASDVVTLRAELDQKINSIWGYQLGFDSQYAKSKVDVKFPVTTNDGGVNNPISTGVKRQASINASDYDLGAYFKNQLQLSEKFQLIPGLRYDYFSQTKESFLLPRLAAKYQLENDLLLKAGTGIYVQAPEPQENDDDFGNPDLKSPKAISSSIGIEKDFRDGSKDGSILSVSLFDRWFSGLVVSSSATVIRNGVSTFELYNNDGAGRAYGLETQWKFFQPEYSGFISYTLSKSTRKDPLKPEYNFEYDQTHNFNLVLAHEFTDQWKISGRFRYVTGNPQTPIVGSTYDADNEVYIPKRGAIYSTRLKDFNQLDIRIDKKVILDDEIWSFYLDIQNVLNTKNPESIQYSYDYSTNTEISGLPFLPAIGVKGEF